MKQQQNYRMHQLAGTDLLFLPCYPGSRSSGGPKSTVTPLQYLCKSAFGRKVFGFCMPEKEHFCISIEIAGRMIEGNTL